MEKKYTRKYLFSLMKRFEESLLRGEAPYCSTAYSQLRRIEVNILPAIGAYFLEKRSKHPAKDDTLSPLFKESWVRLIEETKLALVENNGENYPVHPLSYEGWVSCVIAMYENGMYTLATLKEKAEEYMSGFANDKLSYNNSSHRQTAVQKYQHALEKAKLLFDEDTVTHAKDQIHFLQTG